MFFGSRNAREINLSWESVTRGLNGNGGEANSVLRNWIVGFCRDRRWIVVDPRKCTKSGTDSNQPYRGHPLGNVCYKQTIAVKVWVWDIFSSWFNEIEYIIKHLSYTVHRFLRLYYAPRVCHWWIQQSWWVSYSFFSLQDYIIGRCRSCTMPNEDRYLIMSEGSGGPFYCLLFSFLFSLSCFLNCK